MLWTGIARFANDLSRSTVNQMTSWAGRATPGVSRGSNFGAGGHHFRRGLGLKFLEILYKAHGELMIFLGILVLIRPRAAGVENLLREAREGFRHLKSEGGVLFSWDGIPLPPAHI